MSFGDPYPSDDFLTDGVVPRRCIAWLIDFVLIALLLGGLWWMLVMFGLLTLGIGFAAVGILPWVPLCYHFFSLLASPHATPGQQIMGLTVRRNNDLGPPTTLQALLVVILFYLTMATSGLLLIFALFTIRRRALHDLLSGVVVVRVRALTEGDGDWHMYGGTSAP